MNEVKFLFQIQYTILKMADTGPQPDLDSKRTGDFLSARAAQNENEKEASARES